MSQSLAITSGVTQFLAHLRRTSPFWLSMTWAGLALFVLVYSLGFVDERTFNGVSAWDKPAKFLLSFAVHVLTFAWAFSLMPEQDRSRRSNRILSYAFVTIFALEVLYITFRAKRGEASHFNASSETAALLYSLMGVGSLILTGITGYFGWRLLATRRDIAARAAGTGLVLGAILGTMAGAYLGSQPSHWVGGTMTDAGGLPFFHWSTTGGDLRVAHFVGLHAMQAVPVAAWLMPSGRTIILASAGMTVLCAATFVQAISGLPLFAL
jgi:hypothetical protein